MKRIYSAVYSIYNGVTFHTNMTWYASGNNFMNKTIFNFPFIFVVLLRAFFIEIKLENVVGGSENGHEYY